MCRYMRFIRLTGGIARFRTNYDGSVAVIYHFQFEARLYCGEIS